MGIDHDKPYAVITGDFIGFSGLESRIRGGMPRVMTAAENCINDVMPGLLPYNMAVFRGDSWQTLVAAPEMALRAAVFLRAYIRAHIGHPKVDTRMAIGVGRIDYIPEGQVSAGDGPAFRHSGKLLEKMYSRKSGLLRYAWPGSEHEPLLDAIARMAGALMAGWRPLQAQAVIGKLKGLNQNTIAAQWNPPISPQAVSNHLKQAQWQAISHALSVFEQALKSII